MLYLATFVTGAAVMAFEVLGFRIMAVCFDNRDVINGSLIGAILSALSGGYYLGGLLADRHPKPALLGALVAAGGLSMEYVPSLALWVSRSVLSDPERTGPWGPFLGAAILFAPASFLLGFTPPFVIRLVTTAKKQLGRGAGKVYAISTVGSIFGTLFTTFYLMPATWVGGHSNAMRITGGICFLTGVTLMLWRETWPRSATR